MLYISFFTLPHCQIICLLKWSFLKVCFDNKVDYDHTFPHNMCGVKCFTTLTSATSFWKVSVSLVRPNIKGPLLLDICSSHFIRRGVDTLKGKFPMMCKLGGTETHTMSTFTVLLIRLHTPAESLKCKKNANCSMFSFLMFWTKLLHITDVYMWFWKTKPVLWLRFSQVKSSELYCQSTTCGDTVERNFVSYRTTVFHRDKRHDRY